MTWDMPPPALAYAWGPELCADFEERVAIMEFDGGLDRVAAEKAAVEVCNVVHHQNIDSLARRRCEYELSPEGVLERQNRQEELDRSNAWWKEHARKLWPKKSRHRK